MYELLTNKIFLSATLAAITAQVLKTLVDIYQNKKFNRRSLFRGAGLPSSHTSTVVALSLSVLIIEGPSNMFIITLIISCIVIRDVLGDKIFATHQENIMNEFIQNFITHKPIKWNHLIGHTLTEVISGFLVGILVTIMVFLFTDYIIFFINEIFELINFMIQSFFKLFF